MMKDVKLLILDFDGTVGDSRSLIIKTMMATVKEMQLAPHTEDECAATIGLPLAECFRHLEPMSEEKAEKCCEVYRRIFDENNVPGAVTLFPEVMETLTAFHAQGGIITFASSRHSNTLSAYVRDLGLESMTSMVLGADSVSKAKPDPEPVLMTLRQFGVAPEEALVVGDSRFDILMGKRAGVRSVGVTYGNGTREELQEAGADLLVDNFSDIFA